jgi:hypothetical protein
MTQIYVTIPKTIRTKLFHCEKRICAHTYDPEILCDNHFELCLLVIVALLQTSCHLIYRLTHPLWTDEFPINLVGFYGMLIILTLISALNLSNFQKYNSKVLVKLVDQR